MKRASPWYYPALCCHNPHWLLIIAISAPATIPKLYQRVLPDEGGVLSSTMPVSVPKSVVGSQVDSASSQQVSKMRTSNEWAGGAGKVNNYVHGQCRNSYGHLAADNGVDVPWYGIYIDIHTSRQAGTHWTWQRSETTDTVKHY